MANRKMLQINNNLLNQQPVNTYQPKQFKKTLEIQKKPV